jgi:peptide/nickel transport system permease protein
MLDPPIVYRSITLGFIGLAILSFFLALILIFLGFCDLRLNVGGPFSAEYIQAPWSPARVWGFMKHRVLSMGGHRVTWVFKN